MAARRLFDGAEFEVGGLALESPAPLTFNEIVTDGRTPILWWKLDDASDPADDAAAADNDGILTGTGLFGATAFFPTPNGTVFDTNGGTGYLTSEADSPVSGEDWTMFIFWQLNDAGTVGAIYDTLSPGTSEVHLFYDVDGELHFKVVTDDSVIIDFISSDGRYTNTEPHMLYYADSSGGSDPDASGTWGIDGVWADFGPTGATLDFTAGPIMVGNDDGFFAVGQPDALVAQLILYDDYVGPDVATELFLAAGFSTNPLANMSWINDDDIWDVEANTEEIFEANPSSIAIGATLPAPTVTGNGRTTPAAITRSVVVPAPTVTGGGADDFHTLVLSFNPVLWWQLDDVTDPADDFAAADNDGIKTGTLSFGAANFLPSVSGTVLDTLGTGYLTAESPGPIDGLAFTVIVFFQLNDTSSSGQLFFQSSGGVGRTELSYDGTDFRTRVVPTIGTGSTLLDEFTSGLNDTDPHMWYFTSTSPSITVGSGSWGFDGNFTDFSTTGTDLSFDPGTLTVGGADFVDILVAHVLVFDYSLTPDEARDIFVASGLSPEPVATVEWTGADDIMSVSAVHAPNDADATVAYTQANDVWRVIATTPNPDPYIPGLDFAPVVSATLWTRDGTFQISTLEDAFDVQWQEVVDETGVGKFSLPLGDTAAALIQRGMLVKCNIYNLENVFTWRIENIERVRISQDEEFGEIVNCTGRGVGMRLEDAKIHPYKGVTQKPTPDSRSFSFASPEFDDSSWTFCEVKALQGDLTTEWVGIVDRELTAAPFAWPQNNTWTPGWIWHPDFDTEPGLGYIRKTFELDIDRKVIIVATGDNYWTLYLDGVALLGDNSYPEAWQEHRRVVIDMQAGLHTFAAVVNNIRTSPVAFLLLAYQDNGFTCVPQPDEIGPDGEVIPQDDECEPNEPLVIYVTDASWKILAYPPSEPGMTPGGVMLQLLAEAWSRSQLLDVSPDFDAIFDTDGEPWPQMPEVGARIGDSYLDILKTMTDGEWCDWWMRPVDDDGIFRLSMYVNDGRGNSTAVPFTRSTDAHLGNIADITHETPGKIFNRLLVKYGGGLFTYNLVAHQLAISEVIEEFFACDTSDLQEATRLALREVTTSTATNPAITLTLEPDVDPLRFDKPYVDFKPGDMVYAPDEDGDAEYYRVIGATITQDDEGFPVVSLELNRRTFSVQEQRADLFQTLGSGVVSPKAISGRVDGFQGSGD